MPSSESDRRFADAMRDYERERAPLMNPSSDPPAVSARLGRYALGERLGEGATAVVYRARDAELGRDVAVKILREPLGVHPDVRERFAREARVVAGISHPNVVTVFDAGDMEGRPFLVMELVSGQPLSALIAGGGLELREAVRLVERAARGVSAAHARGVVHRDLKPANILGASTGEPKVADFGLAQVAGADGAITRTGTVLGTPLYMAPEQVRGKTREIDVRTDVYALGAILYQAVTGRPPHAADSVTEIYSKIVSSDPVAPRRLNPRIPVELETVALKALEKEPSSRYPTADAFADDLARFLAGESVLARPPGHAVRMLRWIRRHAVVSAAAAALVIASIAWAGVAVRVSRRAAEAQKLLERGHFDLDQATLYLYSSGADFDDLLRRVEKGQASIEQAVALAPGLAGGHYLLGRAWELRGSHRKAEECWRRAIRIDPAFGPARFDLGRLLLVRSYFAASSKIRNPGKPETGPAESLSREAAAEIEAAATLGGIEEGLPRELAAIMLIFARRDYVEVRTRARQAIADFQGKPGAEELYWIAGLATTPIDERMALFDAALKIRPINAQVLYSRGTARMVHGDPAVAETDLTQALRFRPEMTHAFVNRGFVRRHTGDHDGALADFSAAIGLDPELAVAWLNRGGIKETRGDAAGALADYDEAIRLEPGYVAAYASRGLLRASRDARAGAIADLEKALDLAPPGWKERPAVERRLEELRKL